MCLLRTAIYNFGFLLNITVSFSAKTPNKSTDLCHNFVMNLFYLTLEIQFLPVSITF